LKFYFLFRVDPFGTFPRAIMVPKWNFAGKCVPKWNLGTSKRTSP